MQKALPEFWFPLAFYGGKIGKLPKRDNYLNSGVKAGNDSKGDNPGVICGKEQYDL